jgi:hypothetical protein
MDSIYWNRCFSISVAFCCPSYPCTGMLLAKHLDLKYWEKVMHLLLLIMKYTYSFVTCYGDRYLLTNINQVKTGFSSDLNFLGKNTYHAVRPHIFSFHLIKYSKYLALKSFKITKLAELLQHVVLLCSTQALFSGSPELAQIF